MNLSKMPIFRAKSVKIYTGQKKITRAPLVVLVTNTRYAIIITMTITRKKPMPLFNSIITIYRHDDSIHKEVVITLNLLINIIIMIFIAMIFTTMIVITILEKLETRSCPTPTTQQACLPVIL